MSRAIDRYRDRGSNFDAYMIAMIRLSAKEYGIRKKEHRIIEKTWWDTKAKEAEVCEPAEPDYFEEKPDLPKVPNPRQVLILLLKSYHYLSESHVARLAPAVGLTKEKLVSMIDELRTLRLQRDEAVRALRERTHMQFYRCLAFEKRMLQAPAHSAHRLKMTKCLETAQKRLASMRRRLASMRIEASNEQIAQVLGVKKGTVDSNLHAVKQKNQIETR
jgi:DNA-directed RNA polymerase specialized sigma24 family protein